MSINLNVSIKTSDDYIVSVDAYVVSTDTGCGLGDRPNQRMLGKKFKFTLPYNGRGLYADSIREKIETITGCRVNNLFY